MSGDAFTYTYIQKVKVANAAVFNDVKFLTKREVLMIIMTVFDQ